MKWTGSARKGLFEFPKTLHAIPSFLPVLAHNPGDNRPSVNESPNTLRSTSCRSAEYPNEVGRHSVGRAIDVQGQLS